MTGKKLDIKLDHLGRTYSIMLGSLAALTIADVVGLFFSGFPGLLLNNDSSFNIYIYIQALSVIILFLVSYILYERFDKSYKTLQEHAEALGTEDEKSTK
ncbi:MAG: hypothetical protein MIO93_12980 [ANME-2 cluster archaeon]|nr:hypothetical protein [ANME-2 cluster archaeon]